MPTIASGSGTCAADIYYEVRGDTPSTSNRYIETPLSWRQHDDNKKIELTNWLLREPHNSTEVNILMIMGELTCVLNRV